MSAPVTPSIPSRTDRHQGAQQEFGIHIPKMHLHLSHKNFAPILPFFAKRQVYREELYSLLQIILIKPLYVGFSILSQGTVSCCHRHGDVTL